MSTLTLEQAILRAYRPHDRHVESQLAGSGLTAMQIVQAFYGVEGGREFLVNFLAEHARPPRPRAMCEPAEPNRTQDVAGEALDMAIGQPAHRRHGQGRQHRRHQSRPGANRQNRHQHADARRHHGVFFCRQARCFA